MCDKKGIGFSIPLRASRFARMSVVVFGLMSVVVFGSTLLGCSIAQLCWAGLGWAGLMSVVLT